MSRRPRKNRGSRKARRNAPTEDLPAIGEAGDRDLWVYPINPASLSLAQEAYRLSEAGSRYTNLAFDLLGALHALGVDIWPVRNPDSPNPLNEDTLSVVIRTILGKKPREEDSKAFLAHFQDPEDFGRYLLSVQAASKAATALKETAADLLPLLGMQEELLANTPTPDYGVLAGRGVLDVPGEEAGKPFFAVSGDKSETREERFRGSVLSLGGKVERALLGKGHAVQEVGHHSDPEEIATTTAVFAVAGPQDDPHGMSIFPLSGKQRKTQPFLNTTVEGLIKKAISEGVWDSVAREWTGNVKFAFPAPVRKSRRDDSYGDGLPDVFEGERTQALRFADFVCAPAVQYDGTVGTQSARLNLVFTSRRRSVKGSLALGAKSYPVRGRFEAALKAFVLTSPLNSDLRVEYTPTGENLEGHVLSEGKFETFTAKETIRKRKCPGPGFLDALTRGVEALVSSVTPRNLEDWVIFYVRALKTTRHSEQATQLAAMYGEAEAFKRSAALLPTLKRLQEGLPAVRASQEPTNPRLLFSGFQNLPSELQPLSTDMEDFAHRGKLQEDPRSGLNIQELLALDSKELGGALASRIGLEKPGEYAAIAWQPIPGRIHFLRLTLLSSSDGKRRYTLRFGRDQERRQLQPAEAARLVSDKIQHSKAAASKHRRGVKDVGNVIVNYLAALLRRDEQGKPYLNGIRVKFLGETPRDKDGAPIPGDDVGRYLSGEDWYGDDRQVRGLALTRRGLRERLASQVGEEGAPPLRGLEATAASVQAAWGRENLTQRKLASLQEGQPDPDSPEESVLTSRQASAARKKIETTAWKMGTPARKEDSRGEMLPLTPRFSAQGTPLPESQALRSAVFTVYGLSAPDTFDERQVGEGRHLQPLPAKDWKVDLRNIPEYRPLWRKRFSREELEEIVQTARLAAPPAPPGTVFNEAYAVRAHISDASGLTAQAEEWSDREAASEGKLLAPFLIAGTLEVSAGRLAQSSLQFPRPHIPGGQGGKEASGLYLTTFRIPRKKGNVPLLDPEGTEGLLSVYAPPKALDGLVIAPVTSYNTANLSESLVQAGWNTRSRTLSVRPVKNLLGYRDVSRSEQFRGIVAGLVAKNDALDTPKELSPEAVALKAYMLFLNDGIKGSGGRGISEIVLGGRTAYIAMGGTQAQARRVAGEMISPNVAAKEWATRAARSFSSVFNMAASLFEELGKAPSRGGKRENIVGLLRTGQFLKLAEKDLLQGEDSVLRGEEDVIVLTGATAKRMLAAVATGEKVYAQLPVQNPDRTYLLTVAGNASMGGLPVRFSPHDGAEGDVGAIVHMMLKWGIKVPERSDLAGMKTALEALKDKLVVSYKHRANLGSLLEKIQVDRLRADEHREASFEEGLDPVLRMGEEAEAAKLEGAADFAEPYLKELALPNRGRAPRKPRKPRRRGRRNPLTPESIRKAEEYVRTDKAPAGLEAAFDTLRGGEDYGISAGWPITANKLSALFPEEGPARGWDASERLQTLGTYDLVSRVSDLPPRPDIEEAAAAEKMPFSPRTRDDGSEDWEPLKYIMQHANLSLEEAKKILKAQKEKRQNKRGKTMQASSAFCKTYRSRKLANYVPPPSMLQDHRNDVVIWMSPNDAVRPRVMTFRRGTWVDCDMIGDSPQDMSRLLGQAIQGSLYWLAEKPRRGLNTSLLVGRVGDPFMYRAARAGEVLSLQKVSANLRAGMKGVAGFQVPRYPQGASAAAMAEERNQYRKAAATMPSRRRPTAQAPSLSVPFPSSFPGSSEGGAVDFPPKSDPGSALLAPGSSGIQLDDDDTPFSESD